MNQSRLLKILLSACTSEKISNQEGLCAFRVVKDATKIEIKQAVEKFFNAKVSSVRICNMKGKEKKFQRTVGRRKSWKKAYVQLAPGIDPDELMVSEQ